MTPEQLLQLKFRGDTRWAPNSTIRNWKNNMSVSFERGISETAKRSVAQKVIHVSDMQGMNERREDAIRYSQSRLRGASDG